MEKNSNDEVFEIELTEAIFDERVKCMESLVLNGGPVSGKDENSFREEIGPAFNVAAKALGFPLSMVLAANGKGYLDFLDELKNMVLIGSIKFKLSVADVSMGLGVDEGSFREAVLSLSATELNNILKENK